MMQVRNSFSALPVTHVLPAFFCAVFGAVRSGAIAFVTALFATWMLFGGIAQAQDGAVEADSPDALFNAGLEAARADELGFAVLRFEQAHRLVPLDREIQDARAAAQSEARHRRADEHSSQSFIEGEPSRATWWRFFGAFHPDTYALLVLGGTWLFFGLVIIRRTKTQAAITDALAVGAVAAFATVIGGAVMWVGYGATQDSGVAVVVADDVRFREAPDELARPRTQPNLYRGAVVILRAERDDFMRIQLVDGEQVWVREGAVELVD
ncbi:MAG: hypothetical protein ACJAYU_005430 [Bradymonadia bacterium]|jgi:hypothetical protein